MQSISPELKNEVFRRKEQLEREGFVSQVDGIGYSLNSKQKEIN